MAKTIGHFDYECFGGPDDEEIGLPTSPVVRLHLKDWSQWEKDGPPGISPNLMTEQEIDTHIVLLKADLDAVGAAAKRALRARHPATA